MANLRDLEKKHRELEKRLKKLETRLALTLYPIGEDGRDELFRKAKKIVIDNDNASASFLQRKLMIGYARAARILDELQMAKVIGPALGATPRKILVKQKGTKR